MSSGRRVSIRLVSYNVRRQRDDPGALRRVIRDLEPDVLCLQEGPRWPCWRSSAALLASQTGLVVVSGGPPAGSNLIMSRLRVSVVDIDDVRFPVRHRTQPRGAAVATLAVAGAALTVASTHLSLDPDERAENAAALAEHLANVAARHWVVAGDLNESAGGPAWSRLLDTGLCDAWQLAPRGSENTFPAGSPHQRIDAVLTSAEITVVACGAGGEGPSSSDLAAASDHLPVVADLVLSG